MKKLVILFCMMICAGSFLQAQIQTPAPSPAAKVEQRIGLVDVAVEYSRPSMKGRKIYGDLVPFDAIWRTGANAATKITFSDDVMFGGAEVKKGSYALMTKPGMKSWNVMLYPHNNTSFSSYLESDVVPTTVTVQAYEMPKGVNVESFMIGFDNLSNSGADLYMLWDNMYVPVPIKVTTDKTVEANISKVMSGPAAGDYYSAAQYYYSEKKNLPQALEWINKSISMGNEKFWVLRTKSLIQAELGDKKGAISTAERSLQLAREADNHDYIKMNEDSLMEWKKG